ncbi:hypothetical protein CYMTET_6432 [Cymbomonas tetramitiformis]|uniref:Ubiquitin-like domain-containing protein n=1 Tax=Cymbomonas tetramitiformis TaxID=36881 RepID=A0AAE0GXL0_9CHLO|nr:hypothetical protein CYMTET_6432 [Cymbomonas tetramitiformis]
MSINPLVPLDNELAGWRRTIVLEDEKEHQVCRDASIMYKHDSLVAVAKGFMRTEVFGIYVSKHYPHCEGKSDEWVVSYLIYNYVHFMALIKGYVKHDLYQNMVPPHMLDCIWSHHLLDNRGYNKFCMDNIGQILYRVVSFDGYEGLFKVSQTINAYHQSAQYRETMDQLYKNGLWWNELESLQGNSMIQRSNTASRVRRASQTLDASAVNESAHKRVRTKKTFKVHIKQVSGRDVHMDVSEGMTVDDVAEHVYAELGIPLDVFKLVYKGCLVYNKRLSDDGKSWVHIRGANSTLTLGYLGIEDDATFMLVLDLRGC